MLDQHFGCVTEPGLCLARVKLSLGQKALCPTALGCSSQTSSFVVFQLVRMIVKGMCQCAQTSREGEMVSRRYGLPPGYARRGNVSRMYYWSEALRPKVGASKIFQKRSPPPHPNPLTQGRGDQSNKKYSLF